MATIMEPALALQLLENCAFPKDLHDSGTASSAPFTLAPLLCLQMLLISSTSNHAVIGERILTACVVC